MSLVKKISHFQNISHVIEYFKISTVSCKHASTKHKILNTIQILIDTVLSYSLWIKTHPSFIHIKFDSFIPIIFLRDRVLKLFEFFVFYTHSIFLNVYL